MIIIITTCQVKMKAEKQKLNNIGLYFTPTKYLDICPKNSFIRRMENCFLPEEGTLTTDKYNLCCLALTRE